MSLTIYVTEDFGTMKEEDRFQARVILHHDNIHRLNPTAVAVLEDKRSALHAMNMPEEVAPNPVVRAWKELQYKWYCFRIQLSEAIKPKHVPARASLEAAKLRRASAREHRKILEELWQELGAEREPQLKKVLQIEEPTEFLVEDE